MGTPQAHQQIMRTSTSATSTPLTSGTDDPRLLADIPLSHRAWDMSVHAFHGEIVLMQRRDFLLMLATGTAAALSSCSTARTTTAATALPSTSPSSSPTLPPSPTPSATPSPSHSPLWLQDGPPPLPGPQTLDGVITGLPEAVGNTVAITIDDGADASVVDAYLDFAAESGVRLTFFVTSSYPGWTDCKDKMMPLVESGQVQLANHTLTHPDLTSLSEGGIIEELTACENFLRSTYGVTGAPFIRPPYGYRNEWSDSVCAQLGYTTPTLWYGSFGDSGLLTEDVLLGEANKWLLAQHIVIGHANFPTVTHLYGQIIDLLRERSLLTVTLDDVFFGPGHDRHV